MGTGVESKQPWTPLKVIQWAIPFLGQKGISNPRFDIEVIIAFALKIDRLKVYLQFDRPLNTHELALIKELLIRRSHFEPIQYLTGQREFYGLKFKVSPAVLIPRPETELLVEHAVDYLKQIPEEQRLVLDLGTGSGCIAIAVAKSIPCKIWAVDLSEKALQIAAENAQSLEVNFIQWRKGNWFSALSSEDPPQFQLILSNPPYISSLEREGLNSEVKDFEPPEALFAGKNGLKAYEEIAKNLKNKLLEDGAVIFEVNDKMIDKISDLFKGFKREKRYSDLQGLQRVLKLEK